MTQTAPPDLDAPARSALTGLAKLGLVLRQHGWRERGRTGLTPTQAQVLALLRAEEEPPTLGRVAASLGVTAPTASDAVRVLEAKGFVRKERRGRTLALALTPAGAAEAAAAATWPDELLGVVAELDEDDQAALLRVLTKLIRTLQERGRIPTARMCAGCRFFRPYVHDDARRPHHCAFTDSPFGDGELRLDCADHEPSADPGALWLAFTERRST